MISERINKIRDYINDPRKQFELFQNEKKWNQLCASMDVIEDTQLAIGAYFKLESFDAYKGGYLYLYGILQAFFMQQDAVSSLNYSLFNKNIDFKKDFPELYSIRELGSIKHLGTIPHDKIR